MSKPISEGRGGFDTTAPSSRVILNQRGAVSTRRLLCRASCSTSGGLFRQDGFVVGCHAQPAGGCFDRAASSSGVMLNQRGVVSTGRLRRRASCSTSGGLYRQDGFFVARHAQPAGGCFDRAASSSGVILNQRGAVWKRRLLRRASCSTSGGCFDTTAPSSGVVLKPAEGVQTLAVQRSLDSKLRS